MASEFVTAIGAVIAVLTGMGTMFGWMWRQLDKRFAGVDSWLNGIEDGIVDMKVASARLEGVGAIAVHFEGQPLNRRSSAPWFAR